MNEVGKGPLDHCQSVSNTCQNRCFEDKQTGRVAEANWVKVVQILRQFNAYPSIDEQKKN